MKNVHDDSDIYDEVGQVAKGSFEVAENSCYGVTNTRVTGAIKGGESASNKKAIVMLFIFVIALLLCTISSCVAFTVKIFELQSEITKFSQDCATLKSDLETIRQEMSYNFSRYNNGSGQAFCNVLSRSVSALEMLQEQTAHNYSDIEATFQQFNHNLSQRYASLEIDLDMLQQESIQNFSLLESRTQHLLRSGLSPSTSVISCAALPSSSLSGYYWVRASNGSAVRVYCDMTTCGGVTGGWMRVADLDMTSSSHQCPRGLQQRTDAGRRTYAYQLYQQVALRSISLWQRGIQECVAKL